MLKITKVKLELISDPSLYYFFEKQVRGGVSTTGDVRHAKANTPLIEGHEADKETSQIIYMDANNLYGLAMC